MEFRIVFDDRGSSGFLFPTHKPVICLCAESEMEVKALFERLYKKFDYRILNISVVDYRPVSDL